MLLRWQVEKGKTLLDCEKRCALGTSFFIHRRAGPWSCRLDMHCGRRFYNTIHKTAVNAPKAADPNPNNT